MGQQTRRALQALRRRYAHNFRIDIDIVEMEEWPHETSEESDEGKVWCPTRPELPAWTLNQSEQSYFGMSK